MDAYFSNFWSISPVPFLVYRVPMLCSLLARRDPNDVINFTWTKKSICVKTSFYFLSCNFQFLFYVPFAILKIIIDIIGMQIKVTVVVVFVFYVSREIYGQGLKILQEDEIKENDSVLFWFRGTQLMFPIKYENILFLGRLIISR